MARREIITFFFLRLKPAIKKQKR